ncbi:MAG: phasin family protein [Rhodobacteraceae bacterium]|nr:phasin family protein [Paracoccaceae bacterium]
MLSNFDEMQKLSKDNMELAMESLGTVSKGFQSIATEIANYQKKSFEEGSSAIEKIVGSNSPEKAMEAQGEYLKSAYEGFMGEATKISEMYSELSKEAYKPYESLFAKAAK